MSRHAASPQLLMAALLVSCAGSACWAQATAPPVSGGPPAAKPAAANPTLATVYGEPIKQSELETLLPQFSVQAGGEQRLYDAAMRMLVNEKLLGRFLKEQKVVVPPQEIDEIVNNYEQTARKNNTSLKSELAANNTTPEEFRERISRTLQWKKYVMAKATDAELKKYADTNKDHYTGAMVRARHILISVEPGTSEADKQKKKEQIEAIKKEIDGGKISFADAANKYSEDPGNKRSPSGGELDFFPRKGYYIEPFAAAAFGMKKGEISGPVETEYGYHLIQVTDRKEGGNLEFEKIKPQILEEYAQELQEQVIGPLNKAAEEAKAVKIEPMPAGLIKATPPPVTEPAPATAPAPAPAPAGEPAKAAAPK